MLPKIQGDNFRVAQRVIGSEDKNELDTRNFAQKHQLEAVLYFLPFSLVAVTVGWWMGGYWTFSTPIFVYLVINIMDYVIPKLSRVSSPLKKGQAKTGGRRIFSRLQYGYGPLLRVASILWCLWVSSDASLSIIEILGVVLSVGVMAGAVGITFAHELIHRKKRWERIAGEILLLSVTYHHWSVEHVQGHHRNVGTPKDPATARLGESFFAFLPRSIFGGLRSALCIEAAKAQRQKRLPYGPRNRYFWPDSAVVAVYFGIIHARMESGHVALWFISFIAILQLEAVNYFEHYGLSRRQVSPDRFERVSEKHSWDDCSRVSAYFLANLQRHSDHHLRPGERYNNLSLLEGAPQLPAGYATMLLLALVPPLWFYVMDPRVKELNQHPS